MICRGKKGCKAEFGHKFDIATGRSGLITRYEVFDGNPCDGAVLARALENHRRVFGKAPRRLTADRRYHGKDNEKVAAAAGVEQIALPKPGRLSELRRRLQQAPWFRSLLRWRAGIEGNLSTLLRGFGLKRCLWKGARSFKAYVGWGALTYNLRLLAGHLAGASATQKQAATRRQGQTAPGPICFNHQTARRAPLRGHFAQKGTSTTPDHEISTLARSSIGVLLRGLSKESIIRVATDLFHVFITVTFPVLFIAGFSVVLAYPFVSLCRSFPKTWVLGCAFLFAVFGSTIGALTGGSRTPLVSTLLPALISFVIGYLAFLIHKKANRRLVRLVPACIFSFLVATTTSAFYARKAMPGIANVERVGKLNNASA